METLQEKPKNKAAQRLAGLRHKKLTPARRKEIAEKAAKVRWKDHEKEVVTHFESGQ